MSASSRTGSQVTESPTNLRFQCLQTLVQLHDKGGSLTRLLPDAQQRVAVSEQSQLQAWSFGFCRWAHELSELVDQLLDKPLKAKDLDVYLLMQLGVFQLRHTPVVAHAAVDETVKVVKRLKKPWARGLVNAVLRNYQRRTDALQEGLSLSAKHSHPEWLIATLRKDWPEQWTAICAANNQQAPLFVRVNQRKSTTEQYRQRLLDEGMPAATVAQAPQALRLEQPVPVTRLPGFDRGDVSVQDAAAQLASAWLAEHCQFDSQNQNKDSSVTSGQTAGRLLDACAAPGGKTAHAAEAGLFSNIVALDKDPQRLNSINTTLQRLGLTSEVSVLHADAGDPEQWWDGVPFEAVLLDAPCTGSGVIRRHPDIKLLRWESDVASLVSEQRRLLDALWPTVAEQGVMLYATCSVIKDENEHQVSDFMQRTPDAILLGTPLQILPGENAMDGFFYAAIRKRSA